MYIIMMESDNYNTHVTFLHLRSKELKRMHTPCIPHFRDKTKYTLVYILMYPGKTVYGHQDAQYFEVFDLLHGYNYSAT